MTAIITNGGMIRALQLLTNDISYIGFGSPNPAWSDEFNPPPENINETALYSIVGYAQVNTRGWLVQDSGGTITIDSINYSISGSPTTIAYVSATIPSGQAEGVSNAIGEIGVFGGTVVVSPSDAAWVVGSGVVTPGTLIRIQYYPIFIKPPNTEIQYLVAFPLLT